MAGQLTPPGALPPEFPLTLLLSPGETSLFARRHSLQVSIGFVAIARRFNPYHHALHQYLRSTSFSSSQNKLQHPI